MLTFKNLTENRAMSEETVCFSATIHLHGRKVGTIQNDGRGGMARLWVEPEAYSELYDLCEPAYRQWFEATIGPMTREPMLEDMVEHAAMEALNRKQERAILKKLKTTRALCHDLGAGRMEYIALRDGDTPDAVAKLRNITSWQLVTA